MARVGTAAAALFGVLLLASVLRADAVVSMGPEGGFETMTLCAHCSDTAGGCARDPGAKVYHPPVGTCFSPPALWPGDGAWGLHDVMDAVACAGSAASLTRTFYATRNGTCLGGAVGAVSTPFLTMRMTRGLCCGRVPSLSIIDGRVEEYARRAPLHVAPDYVIKFCESVDEASLLTYSRYLHKELPVRFARTLKDYQALPYIVGVNPHVEKIHAELSATFKKVIDHPKPVDWATHESWVALVDDRLRIHADTISDLSRGLKEVGILADRGRNDGNYFNHFLDRAFIQRIGRRVLCELLLVLHQTVKHGCVKQPNQVGVFTKVRPQEMVHHVMSQVSYLAQTYHERDVEYEIVGDTHAELLCIASHMEYILFELCKNAVLATLGKHPTGTPPKITFRVCAGDAVTVVISDRGGGIPEAAAESQGHASWHNQTLHQTQQAHPWSYGFSTAPPSQCDDEYFTTNVDYSAYDTTQRIQFAGFGFGLPLCSVYSRFNGGSLRYLSLPGYGTDMHLTIPDAYTLRACTSERTTRIGTFEDHDDEHDPPVIHAAPAQVVWRPHGGLAATA